MPLKDISNESNRITTNSSSEAKFLKFKKDSF